MSEDQVTQAVVDDTPAPAVQGAADTNARAEDDLDSLLSTFDAGVKKVDPPAPAKPAQVADAGGDTTGVLEEIRSFRQERAVEHAKRAVDEMVKTVRGELDPEFFDDKFVEAWLDAQARGDTRFKDAFLNREANPKQFQKIVETMGRSFAKKFGRLPDKQATEDRAAVTAAVRGSSTKVPEGKAPDFKGMSDSEFRNSVKEKYGFNPI